MEIILMEDRVIRIAYKYDHAILSESADKFNKFARNESCFSSQRVLPIGED